MLVAFGWLATTMRCSIPKTSGMLESRLVESALVRRARSFQNGANELRLGERIALAGFGRGAAMFCGKARYRRGTHVFDAQSRAGHHRVDAGRFRREARRPIAVAGNDLDYGYYGATG